MAAVREKYRALVELAPDPIFLIRIDAAEIAEVNRSACNLLGYERDQLEGKSVTMLHPDDQQHAYRHLFERTLEDGEIQADELPDGGQLFLVTADDDQIPVTLHARTIELDGDRCVFTIARDVTERFDYEQQLERKNDRLEKFASIISHDLRNPLGVALGHLDLARQDCENEHLETVAGALDRMETIVDGTLQLARRGRTIDDASDASLSAVVDDAWEMCASDDITIHNELPEDLSVSGDPDRLGHLFENLFRNAIEHAGAGATVTVGHMSGGFFVADDGPGIPPDDRDTLFRAGGSGEDDRLSFGLDIVRRIAVAHGWSVDVTESEDGGSRFEFSDVTFHSA